MIQRAKDSIGCSSTGLTDTLPSPQRTALFFLILFTLTDSKQRYCQAAVPDIVDGLGREQCTQPTRLGQTISRFCAPHLHDRAGCLHRPWAARILVVGGMTNPIPEAHATQESSKPVAPETICTQTVESLQLRPNDGTDVDGVSWAVGPSLAHKRCLHAAVALRHCVLVVGGSNGNQVLPSVEAFRPHSDATWTRRPNMVLPRSGLAASVVNERAYAIGGCVSLGSKNLSSSMESWADGDAAWTLEAPMPQALSKHAAVAGPDGKIYVTGGRNSSALQDSVYSYDHHSKLWRREAPMRQARMAHACVHAEGRIYVLGGYVGVDSSGDSIVPVRLSSVESYDPQEGRWRDEASMPSARSGHAAVYHNGTIYVFGGCISSDSHRSALVEGYDIEGGTWRTEQPMMMERFSFNAVLMPEY